MEISNLIPHIEALIFASDKPLTSAEITELINGAFGFMDEKIVVEQVDASIEGIVEKYDSEFYPFEVRQSGGGWQFLTKKDFHKTVAQLNGEKFLKRLSGAALETLAIIAYKQPITKGEIESIRGVSSDYSVQKLLEKELIVISGRNEKLPGHPLVYATSKTFMDYFGINSPEDLPKIKEVLAEQAVQPTLISPEDFEQSNLVVSDEGELLVDHPTATTPANEEEQNPSSENDENIPDTDGLKTEDGDAAQHLNGHAFEIEIEGEEEGMDDDDNADDPIADDDIASDDANSDEESPADGDDSEK